jgi:uncharacterized membrane protein YdjX (TVP38/TMEM64 family)
MVGDILKIAILCILIGAASIPVSFGVNNSPVVVWFGNALGSLISAAVVIYIGERITNQNFKDRLKKRRYGKKVVRTFDEGNRNKKVIKAREFINNRGIKIFSLLCPIFPGVLIATTAVYLLELDKKTYKRWMAVGVFFVSGIYVCGYWLLFVK